MNILQISFHTAPMNSLGVNDGGGLNVYVESISKELAKDNRVHIITGEQAKNMSKKNLKLTSFNLFSNQAQFKIWNVAPSTDVPVYTIGTSSDFSSDSGDNKDSIGIKFDITRFNLKISLTLYL